MCTKMWQLASTDVYSSQPGPAINSQVWHGYFNAISYRPYFNVGTRDVVIRIIASLFPCGGGFAEKTNNNPDM